MAGSLKVTQIKSTIRHIARNRATIKALGLHGIGSSVEVAGQSSDARHGPPGPVPRDCRGGRSTGRAARTGDAEEKA